ncbi:hypothetical protein [Methylobacterium radiotolerans]|uniref:hypothetical protein n=1 Tax=Methylobacterium radiotolerans TaxID=31998 RepID=UPI0038D0A4E7
MAALFAWQFAGALPYVGTGENVLTRFVGGSHFTLGFILFVLVVLRWAWGLANLARRPPPRGRLGRAAVAGDLLIYAPMMVVPGLPLKRPYGSIKPFRPYGIRSCEGATRGSPGGRPRRPAPSLAHLRAARDGGRPRGYCVPSPGAPARGRAGADGLRPGVGRCLDPLDERVRSVATTAR